MTSGGETSDDGGGVGSGGMSAAEIKKAKAAAKAAADDPGLRPESMPAEVYVSLRALEALMAAGDGTGLAESGAGKGQSFSVSEALEWLRRNGERISSRFRLFLLLAFPATAEERLDALAAARFVAPPYGAAVPSSSADDSSSSSAPALAASSTFLTTSVSTLPLDTTLLLARRAPPAKPPLPLNARVSWLGPARPAPLVASGMRTRILALYDAHLADDGKGVDYGGLLEDPRFADFCCAAGELQALGLRDLEVLVPAERAALFINVYNAMIVHATAARGAPADSPAARAAFFGSAGGAAYTCGGLCLHGRRRRARRAAVQRPLRGVRGRRAAAALGDALPARRPPRRAGAAAAGRARARGAQLRRPLLPPYQGLRRQLLVGGP